MFESFSYGWIYISALGLGLFLSSLVRKRHFFWIGLGFFLILISQGGALLSGLYDSPENLKELGIIFAALSFFFFLISLKLIVILSVLLIFFSFYFIYWGSSGIFSLEKGVYPVRIISYPPTDQGRSFNIRFANGRESTLGGAGDYLVMEKVYWERFLVFLPGKTRPAGLVPQGTDRLADDEAILEFTFEKPVLLTRPGLKRELFLLGPIENDLFYTLWLTDSENLSLTSVEPLDY